MTELSLFAGPLSSAGPESFRDHLKRLGPRPRGDRALIDTLDRSGLVGRGGASFPVGVKWRSVQSRSRGAAVVIANGAEGEPLSRKDRTLMALRPHLVIDGALLAADAVGAQNLQRLEPAVGGEVVYDDRLAGRARDVVLYR